MMNLNAITAGLNVSGLKNTIRRNLQQAIPSSAADSFVRQATEERNSAPETKFGASCCG
ncbi:MAG: hypothetical protein K2X01_02905 [Cyanobacteria bacterium]|nr:hypothetical protein [Cyanobacteriota bacterium]